MSTALTSQTEPSPAEVRRQARVLIVDDNHDAAESLGTLLSLHGIESRTVNDGPSALAEVDAYRPEVVLLDIGMPGMNGYEVARALRQRESTKHSLLVALTGFGYESDRLKAIEAGFDHHLVKPVDVDVLLPLVSPEPLPEAAAT